MVVADGWRVEGGPDVLTGNTAADFAREAINAGQTHIRFVSSERQSLTLETNGVRVMLILWGREGDDKGLQAIDPTAGNGSQGGYVLDNGQHDTYADRATVPLDQAIEAVRHIIENAAPDPRIEWKGW